MEKLTKGQKEALEAVRTGRNVCITGGGGVGKSYIPKNHRRSAETRIKLNRSLRR